MLLRRERGLAGLTQAELADRAGRGERTVSNLERGINRAPYLSTVRLLADALDLSNTSRAELLAAARDASGLLTAAGGGYAFDHALTQQALYAALSPARRRRVHRGAADMLERRPPGS